MQLFHGVSSADFSELLRNLATTLTGSLVVASNLTVAVTRLQEALERKSCLVVFDDVWDYQMAARIHESFSGTTTSSLLLSTRIHSIASQRNVTTPIEIGVLGAQAAENMLLVHAESGARALHVDKTDALVQRVLSLCGGLPMALSVVGSLVRRRGWVSALELVDESGRGLLNLRVPGGEVRGRTEYESLRKCLQASLMALGEDTYDRERKCEQFLQLCVVRTKEQLPLTALCSL